MTLLLDPDIRDWVVLPLFVLIVITGLLRHVVGQYMMGTKQPMPVVVQKTHGIRKQTSRIKTVAGAYLTNATARKLHAVELLREHADLLEEQAEAEKEAGTTTGTDPMEAIMNNPMSMLGGNMIFMVQNMAMMQGIQHFFSGFILLRVPFPLTVGFKNMFQRGIADIELEPAYTSSVSWYFLVLYGLRTFFKLAFGFLPSPEQREQDIVLHKMGLQQNQQNPAAPKQDAEAMAKLLRQEADTLEMLSIFKSEIDTVEKRLLGKQRYPKKKLTTSADAEFLLGGGGSKKNKSSLSKVAKKKQ